MALTAQGFNAWRRGSRIGPMQLRKGIEQLALLQIDSVSVLVRSHYLPLYSRLGPYDRSQLDAVTTATPRRFFEYWGHEASILPVDCHPLLRWRMARAAEGQGIWQGMAQFATEKRALADALLRRIRDDGPLAASDIDAARPSSKAMWARSEAKQALEWLFWAGLVTATHRRSSFERVYDLPERVLPAHVLATPTPSDADAYRELMARSARALGIATFGDLRDYFRLSPTDAKPALDTLVEDGTVTPVSVRGWQHPAYIHTDARAGRSIDGAALLSPFDPLVWHRPRAERIFGFRYRLEIYTPAHKREHGYYVLPFLLDGQLVARVDLKADRKAGLLVVQRVHLEAGAPAETRERLHAELLLMATWLSLETVSYAGGAKA